MLESLTGRQHADFLTFIPGNHLSSKTGWNRTDYAKSCDNKWNTQRALKLPDYCIWFNFIDSLTESALKKSSINVLHTSVGHTASKQDHNKTKNPSRCEEPLCPSSTLRIFPTLATKDLMCSLCHFMSFVSKVLHPWGDIKSKLEGFSGECNATACLQNTKKCHDNEGHVFRQALQENVGRDQAIFRRFAA